MTFVVQYIHVTNIFSSAGSGQAGSIVPVFGASSVGGCSAKLYLNNPFRTTALVSLMRKR